ncbi:hypothetical protein [Pandoraea sp. CB10b_02]|uniref:hypothetical protein n=1 Tax=Pandoraea sp. CB10b_02 TaxID=2014535 RepID=UPI00257AFC02|nr:hypothetical protein [Pandoraea sp. CB10b_02]
MATNDFLTFAGGSGANVLSQADYAALKSILSNGFSSGVAQSAQVNKVLRQASIMSAVVAKLICDVTAKDAIDDGTTATLTSNLIEAIQAIGDARYPRAYSIAALPTKNVGPITVIEAGEIWLWTSTQYFTGYRSPLCGRPLDGHTTVPLASEVDAVGGTLSKTAYAGLWGYAQENGLVVPAASWTSGMHRFVDLGGNNFRCPDLRNQFRRYTGTDADTANATTLGSYKTDTLRSHSHGLSPTYISTDLSGDANIGSGSYQIRRTSATQTFGSAETAPRHTAYAPRIHV